MKLEIKRETEGSKGLFEGAKFTYKLSVKLFPSDEESQLFQKYNYSDKLLIPYSRSEALIGGSGTVFFNSLLKGCTWTASELYGVFTQIPTVIRERLEEMKAELKARESWHGSDEEIGI